MSLKTAGQNRIKIYWYGVRSAQCCNLHVKFCNVNRSHMSRVVFGVFFCSKDLEQPSPSLFKSVHVHQEDLERFQRNTKARFHVTMHHLSILNVFTQFISACHFSPYCTRWSAHLKQQRTDGRCESDIGCWNLTELSVHIITGPCGCKQPSRNKWWVCQLLLHIWWSHEGTCMERTNIERPRDRMLWLSCCKVTARTSVHLTDDYYWAEFKSFHFKRWQEDSFPLWSWRQWQWPLYFVSSRTSFKFALLHVVEMEK